MFAAAAAVAAAASAVSAVVPAATSQGIGCGEANRGLAGTYGSHGIGSHGIEDAEGGDEASSANPGAKTGEPNAGVPDAEPGPQAVERGR
jgi:hypothetical protein